MLHLRTPMNTAVAPSAVTAVTAVTPSASPTNAQLDQRRAAAAPRGVGIGFPIYADRALNSEIWDVEGHRYIDFAAGIAVLNTGQIGRAHV